VSHGSVAFVAATEAHGVRGGGFHTIVRICLNQTIQAPLINLTDLTVESGSLTLGPVTLPLLGSQAGGGPCPRVVDGTRTALSSEGDGTESGETGMPNGVKRSGGKKLDSPRVD
jgi:hypothetical protein